MTIEELQEEVKRLEIEQETNKALRNNILDKLKKDYGLDSIDSAQEEVTKLQEQRNTLQEQLKESLAKIKGMIDEYKRNK